MARGSEMKIFFGDEDGGQRAEHGAKRFAARRVSLVLAAGVTTEKTGGERKRSCLWDLLVLADTYLPAHFYF